MQELIEKLNASAAYKIAVDIPSGIRSDTGNVSSVAVRADMTVTFAARKLGQCCIRRRILRKNRLPLCRIPVRKEDAAAFLPGRRIYADFLDGCHGRIRGRAGRCC